MNNKIIEGYSSNIYSPDFKAWDIKSNKWSDVTNLTDLMVLYQDGCVNLHPFTGFLDKNKNKIYTSYIIKVDDIFAKNIGASRKKMLVGFSNGCYMVGRSANYFDMNTYLYIVYNFCTIVGSIYENSEILKYLKDNHYGDE